MGTYQGNKLTRNLSGNTRLQSSKLAGPLSTEYALKKWNCVRDLISTLVNRRPFPLKPRTNKDKATTSGHPSVLEDGGIRDWEIRVTLHLLA